MEGVGTNSPRNGVQLIANRLEPMILLITKSLFGQSPIKLD
jgi:hypothetical protein